MLVSGQLTLVPHSLPLRTLAITSNAFQSALEVPLLYFGT